MRAYLVPLLVVMAACVPTEGDRRPEGGAGSPGYYLPLDGASDLDGEVSFTDPRGVAPRTLRVGNSGLQVRLSLDGEPAGGRVVRVVYRRMGAADARAFVAVEAPWEPGLYLGTLHVNAPGEWRIQVTVVDDGERARGKLAFTVHES